MENNTGGSLNQNDQNQGSGSQYQNDLQNDQQPSHEGMGRAGAQEQHSNDGQDNSGNNSQNQDWNSNQNQDGSNRSNQQEQQEQQLDDDSNYRSEDTTGNESDLNDSDRLGDSQI